MPPPSLYGPLYYFSAMSEPGNISSAGPVELPGFRELFSGMHLIVFTRREEGTEVILSRLCGSPSDEESGPYIVFKGLESLISLVLSLTTCGMQLDSHAIVSGWNHGMRNKTMELSTASLKPDTSRPPSRSPPRGVIHCDDIQKSSDSTTKHLCVDPLKKHTCPVCPRAFQRQVLMPPSIFETVLTSSL